MPLDAEGNWHEPRSGDTGHSPFSNEGIRRGIERVIIGDRFVYSTIKTEETSHVLLQEGFSIAQVERLSKQFRKAAKEGYWVRDDSGRARYLVYGRTYPNASLDFVKVYSARGRLLLSKRGQDASFLMGAKGYVGSKDPSESEFSFWNRNVVPRHVQSDDLRKE